ncbi:MAG: Verru_Chthon cassette protein A [Prosthecobacter sp.]|uniref:Verru_Chthon cassette protein A n=1 Tax=Prosthecobacter sp. TaxID=1965333 RepID=UPI0039042C6B
MQDHLTSRHRRRQKAIALIIVISVVALMSLLIVAMFTLSQTEYKATNNYIAGRNAKQLADMAAYMVQAQIQNGQNMQGQPNNGTFHATQPGMVRVYNADGSFKEAYKLYSSSQMKVAAAGSSGEGVLLAADQLVPSNWNSDSMKARYVDLNEPVIRPAINSGSGGSGGNSSQTSLYFPIIDPRAAQNSLSGSNTQYTPDNPPPRSSQTSQVEGFWYAKTNSGSGQPYADVVTPQDVSSSQSDQLRLPMPVEWLYILQDGTVGVLNATNKFVSSSSVTASASNPIVGRVAFWTDDEACKINVNTAGEPTYSGTPFYYHERDRRWAYFPAATGEFQRYPGHPATVALSSVLAPNLRLDPLLPDSGMTLTSIVETKEDIYSLLPKLSGGGSYAGTRPFVNDDLSPTMGETLPEAQIINFSAAQGKRLFASVDEMIFKDTLSNSDYDTTKGRQPAYKTIKGLSGRVLFDRQTLERSRFFLTASSRAPDFSIFGMPRVSIWPVDEDDSTGNQRRTNFDTAIALSSSLKSSSEALSQSRSYIFRRRKAHDPDYDVQIQRNQALLNYLTAQMSNRIWPSTSTLGSSTNFRQKYGSDNVNQLAMQFFDYIRCTNLYDGILARQNTDGLRASAQSGTNLYTTRDGMDSTYKTFTNQRISGPPSKISDVDKNRSDDGGVVPGHGQVTPAMWQQKYKGFGRAITLSEVGFSFICTADGDPDPRYRLNYGPDPNPSGGGGTAPYVEPLTLAPNGQPQNVSNQIAYPNMSMIPYGPGGTAVWYSNFPPLSKRDSSPTGLLYGTTASGDPQRHPSRHPGYDPKFWNTTLEVDTPLLPGQSRVQAIIMLEAFCPSLGWTKIRPEYTFELDGDWVNQIFLTDASGKRQRLFDTAGRLVIKDNANLYEGANTNGTRPSGGHAGPSNIMGGRLTRAIAGAGSVSMDSDFLNGQRYNSGNTNGHNSLTDYTFTSNFLTVDNRGEMKLEFPNGDFVVKIYDTHDWQKTKPIQTIRINMSRGANAKIPVPMLAGSQKHQQLRTTNGLAAHPNTSYFQQEDQFGRIKYWRAVPGPHWWCYNANGALMRWMGQVNSGYGQSGENLYSVTPRLVTQNDIIPGATPSLRQVCRGRLDNGADREPAAPGGAQGVGLVVDGFADVIRSFVPTVGDYRIIAARLETPSTMWRPHPSWEFGPQAIRQAHSFTNFFGWGEGRARLATSQTDTSDLPRARPELMLVGGADRYIYSPQTRNLMQPDNGDYNKRLPDFPGHPDWALAANAFGDFDTGVGDAREGPYINKPDEGNFYAGKEELKANQFYYFRGGYFYESWKQSDDWRSGIYMTPNRMISSPVMFGSLPTAVFGGSAGSNPNPMTGSLSAAATEYRPWQTLLFRPHVRISTPPASQTNHPGEHNPRDHYLLEMFTMPVVEPYAISEPLSTAGRINLNYQIMPFTNITRATGLHALMKAEMITAVPNIDIHLAKQYVFRNPSSNVIDLTTPGAFWNEQADQKFWHRSINVYETLRQFDERFRCDSQLPVRTRGLFRSPSQICEVHLIPEFRSGSVNVGGNTPNPRLSVSSRPQAMENFWLNCRVTADNVRERPYSNLYSRITTRSNTFRVHVRSQMVKKTRSSAPDVFDPVKDAVLSEYRGSMLVERYVDLNDSNNRVPDHPVDGVNAPSLDNYYRFRVLETKRFSP